MKLFIAFRGNVMKTNLLLTAAASVLVLSSSSVLAAEATGEGTITAKVVSPVSIAQTQALDFGTMIAPSSPATVTINASNGSRSSSDDAILVGTSEGAAGIFKITGADKQSVTVTLPSKVTLNGSESGTMTVDTFSSEQGTNFELDGGSALMNVGAVLHVGETQPEGTYSGSYEVTVSY